MSTNSVLSTYMALRRKIALLRGQAMKDSEFGHNQISILYRLSLSNATLSELVEYALSDKASTSRTVNLLEKGGLIKKVVDETDRRVVNIELTAKGRSRAKKAGQIRQAIANKLDEGLTSSERKQFKILVDKILEHI